MRIRAPKDFWSGVMFCGFAAVAILAARGYSVGSAGKMGPGYFPLLLGGVLAGLGAILIVRSIAVDGESLARFHLLPLAVVVVAVCLFGAMIEAVKLEVTKTLSAVEIRAQSDVPKADDQQHVENVRMQHAQYDDAGNGGGDGDVALAEAATKKAQPQVRHTQKVGRNDPCPCGSGKKYKHCHGKLS